MCRPSDFPPYTQDQDPGRAAHLAHPCSPARPDQCRYCAAALAAHDLDDHSSCHPRGCDFVEIRG